MAAVPDNDMPVDDDVVVGFLTSGLHGCLSLLERSSNSGARFGVQAEYELIGARTRLEILIQAVKQRVKLKDVQGVDPRAIERAYLDKPDTKNPDRLKG